MRALIPLFAASMLAACTTCPQSADIRHPAVSFAGKDDMGRPMLKSDPTWTHRVAVYSPDAEIQKKAAQLVQKNFSINLVPLPESHFLVRLLHCSNELTIGICVNAQFDGKIISITELTTKAKCDDKTAQHILEDFLFRQTDTQNEFVDFVGAAMDAVPNK